MAFKSTLQRFYRSITFIALALWVAPVHAIVPSEALLASYESQIYTNPQKAYQTLNEALTSQNMTQSQRVWLLLRKAQSEDVLTLYDDVASTLSALSPLLNIMSPEQKAWFDYLTGVHAHKSGEIQRGVEILQGTVDSLASSPDSTIYALAVRELGYALSLSGDYFKANSVLHGAYQELISFQNPFYNGLLEESLGDTYNYSGDFENAVNYYQGALGYFESLDYKPFIASTLLGLAIVHRRLQHWDEALSTFDRYEQVLAFTGEYSEHYYLHYGRAMTLAEMGACEQAMVAIDDALALSGIIDYDAELYKKRALCNLQSNNIDEAKQDLSAARSMLDSLPGLKGTQWYLELEYIQSLIASKQGDFVNAFELLNGYYRESIALQDKNRSDLITQLRVSLEAERKDKEIEFLKQRDQLRDVEAAQQSLRVQQQRLLIVSIVVVSILLLVFALMQLRNSKKLLALSIRDDLTGLHNRRYLFDYFENWTNSSHANDSELAVLYFDIDDFKHINDTWGHKAGDKVIINIARIAESVLRADDILCRLGGDEFLIVLPRASLIDTKDVAGRLMEEIGHHSLTIRQGVEVSLTISIGIAHFAADGTQPLDIEKMLDSADKGLYQSKREGKNRYTIT
ncbi:tetratricopeptide repeat-containing diguanylate cyclase [Alteromonas facilis]|uniref:tetratricopeptide repeat-containing diguanylate cyclase n=1 Tax=Alteromonas facilis TaxID=2048004 RepID=UPI000C2921A0|nr:tetratricopeptide repeat-containing diguanylate cyclase [Alteromonas facilis]